MKKCNIKIAILVSMISLLFISTVFAKEISFKNDVSANKVWTVKLSKPVSWKSIDDNLKVTDSKGNVASIRAAVGVQQDSIIILPPEKGYKLGETYTITIKEGLRDNKDKALKEATSMKFKVK